MVAVKLFIISLIYEIGVKMSNTWLMTIAKKLLKNILKSVKMSKEDIMKVVDYADKDANGIIDAEELLGLILEYRSIKK
jgi:hypothetical protein